MLESTSCEIGTYSIPVAIEFKSTEIAITIQFFVNVISRHKRAGRHQIEGRTWNYCSLQELKEYFPFWTDKMIRTRIDQLIKLGVLITCNHNLTKYDRTLWYAFKDESRWGIDKIESICPKGQDHLPNRANGFAQKGEPIPLTNHLPTHPLLVNDGASPSLSSSQAQKRSMEGCVSKKKKCRFSETQIKAFNFLSDQKIDTSPDTLSWWARNYSLERLKEVLAEAKKRTPKSIGAYMQKLLKAESVIVNDQIEENKKLAEYFKELNNWHSMSIYQRYAKIPVGKSWIEIDFNMKTDRFMTLLNEKFESCAARKGRSY